MYDLASRLDLGLSCAEDLFDLEFFVDDPEPFFKFAKVTNATRRIYVFIQMFHCCGRGTTAVVVVDDKRYCFNITVQQFARAANNK